MNDYLHNPFAASIGSIPEYFAGKANNEITKSILASLDNPNDPSHTSMIVGSVGIGKTSLLKHISIECGSKGGWIPVNVSCTNTLLEDVLQQAATNAVNFLTPKKRSRLSSLGAEFSGGLPETIMPNSPQLKVKIGWESLPEPQNSWRTKMTMILDELEESEIGILITLDETIPSEQLSDFLNDYHLFLLEQRRIALVVAALPETAVSIKNMSNTTFLQRSEQYYLHRFTDDDTKAALVETAEIGGKTFMPDALCNAVSVIKGFPYMMQLVGHYSWEAADSGNNRNIIDIDAVNKGIDAARKTFRNTIIRQLMESLSSDEFSFLLAMIQDEGQSSVKTIAERNEWNTFKISPIRRKLIEKGIIENNLREYVRFVLPELREYLIEEYSM